METVLFSRFDVELAPSTVAIGMTAPVYAIASFPGVASFETSLALIACLVGLDSGRADPPRRT